MTPGLAGVYDEHQEAWRKSVVCASVEVAHDLLRSVSVRRTQAMSVGDGD